MIAYFNGQFVQKDQIAVSPDDRGFLFGDGVYEVVRVYGGRPFALAQHDVRLHRSLDAVSIEWPDVSRFRGIVTRLLSDNDLGHADALLYAQVTRGVAPRLHAFPPAGTLPTVYIVPSLYETSPSALPKVKVVLVPDIRWARCDVKSIALLPNVLAQQTAVDQGADEAIFVRDGFLTEGTHTNVAVVVDGKLITHPLTNRVLPGVTRDAAVELCTALGVPVEERPIHTDELAGVDEMMLLGTTKEVAPVVRVDDMVIADGHAGPVTQQLAQAYGALVRGRCR